MAAPDPPAPYRVVYSGAVEQRRELSNEAIARGDGPAFAAVQWLVEADLYGKDDAPRGIGSGLSTVEAGLRLRYEFTRKFAPYIGAVWERATLAPQRSAGMRGKTSTTPASWRASASGSDGK